MSSHCLPEYIAVSAYRYIVSIALFILPFFTGAQIINGKISNSNQEPIPYATIYVSETREGTISNTQGNFTLNLPRGKYNLTIRSMGYQQLKKEIELNTDSSFIDITLKKQEFEIKEVKVFPGKEDPAYFIIRKAIAKAPYYRKITEYYTADLYIKSNFTFTNIPKLYQNKIELDDGKKLKDYFKENVTYVIESQNKITFTYPNKYEQEVISKRTSLVGFDEPPVMELMTVSFYEERPNNVISPISPLALKHYNFQYEGFIQDGETDIFKIKVSPKRSSDELVEGYIYIVDKLWCIYNIDFESGFEFFDYRIKQQFENLGNNNWLPVSHRINGDFGILGLRGMFYYGASVKYDSIRNNPEFIIKEINTSPALNDSISRQPGEKEQELADKLEQIQEKENLTNRDVRKAARLNRKIAREQYLDSTIVSTGYSNYQVEEKKDTSISNTAWDTLRAIPLTPAEIASYQLADSLRGMETPTTDSTSTEKPQKKNITFSKIAFGHYDLSKDSLIRLGYDGLINTENFDFNTVDGYKYRQQLRLRYTPDSGKYIYLTPEIGYAFNRKAIFSRVHFSLQNIIADGNSIFLNAGNESRDFKPSPLGIEPALNAISSWFFAKNYMKLYEDGFIQLGTSQRIKKHFRASVRVLYNRFNPLKNSVSYTLSDKKEYEPNIPKGHTEDSPELAKQKSFSYFAELSYRKRQEKPWLETSPFLFLNDQLEWSISWKQGIKDVLSTSSDFGLVELNFHQQANMSPSAGIDWKVKTGHFINAKQMHFSQFAHFNTAEIPVGFTSFTHQFQGINDYEFSTNHSYVHVGAELRTEYILLRYLSFINKNTWSESFHINYLTTSAIKNYWETGYSLNSLFFAGNIGCFVGFNGNEFDNFTIKFSVSVFD